MLYLFGKNVSANFKTYTWHLLFIFHVNWKFLYSATIGAHAFLFGYLSLFVTFLEALFLLSLELKFIFTLIKMNFPSPQHYQRTN
jgi:hypothetical protein